MLPNFCGRSSARKELMTMKNNKILTALLSIAIAIGLWFYVVTVVKPESTNTYYNIPVVLEGENILLNNRNLMIVGGKDATVTMELFGNRTDLDKVNSGNITLIADLTKIYEGGEVELTYSHRFPGDVPSGALTVMSKSPSTIKLKVEERVTNFVDVEPIYIGEMPDKDMYIVDTKKAELDTTKVQIAGPKSVIEQIDKATINVDLTGQIETFMVKDRITLRDKDGNPVDASLVTTNVEEVTLTLPIRYFKYIPLDIEVVDGGGATRENSSIQFNPARIMVSGSKEVLSKKTVILLPGSIDLGKLTQAVEEPFSILLEKGLTCESGETEATVMVSFPNLGTQELTVTNIQALNVPEGLECEIMAKELKVTVRGPKDVAARVKPTDLTVTIDFSTAVAGTETYTPVITVDQTKCPGVGVIGEYSISATLQDAAAAQTADATTPG